MFKDFNISKFKKNKPPGDNSITTKNEIKELKKYLLGKSLLTKWTMAKNCLPKL